MHICMHICMCICTYIHMHIYHLLVDTQSSTRQKSLVFRSTCNTKSTRCPFRCRKRALNIYVYTSPVCVGMRGVNTHSSDTHNQNTFCAHTESVLLGSSLRLQSVVLGNVLDISLHPSHMPATNWHCNKSVMQQIGTALRVDRPFCRQKVVLLSCVQQTMCVRVLLHLQPRNLRRALQAVEVAAPTVCGLHTSCLSSPMRQAIVATWRRCTLRIHLHIFITYEYMCLHSCIQYILYSCVLYAICIRVYCQSPRVRQANIATRSPLEATVAPCVYTCMIQVSFINEYACHDISWHAYSFMNEIIIATQRCCTLRTHICVHYT